MNVGKCVDCTERWASGVSEHHHPGYKYYCRFLEYNELPKDFGCTRFIGKSEKPKKAYFYVNVMCPVCKRTMERNENIIRCIFEKCILFGRVFEQPSCILKEL